MRPLCSRAWKFHLALGLLAAALFVVSDAPWLQGALQISGYALSSVLLGVLWWRRRGTRPEPLLTWGFLTFLAFSCANVVGVVWPLTATEPVPVPSPLDALFLLSYASFSGLLWRVSSRVGPSGHREYLDPLIVVVGLAPAFWIFLVEPLLTSAVVTATLVTYIAYPLMVFGLLAVTVRGAFLVFRLAVPHLLLAGWIVLELAADVAYLQVGVAGNYSYGQAWQALWVLSAFCVGALALHPAAGLLLEPPAVARPPRSRVRLSLLAVSLALPLITLTYAHDISRRAALTCILAGLVLIVLVCLRLSDLMVDLAEQRRIRMELQQLSSEMSYQSLHDPLTGLGNRALFAERTEHALAQRVQDAQSGAVVLLLDLDDFKAVNDTFGHEAGDRVLVEVARRLQQVVRQAEDVFRLGGDEFAFVLARARLADALRLADRVCAALEQPFDLGPRQIRPTASIGISIALDGQDRSTLLAEADLAMYAAKTRGAGAAAVFDPQLHREVLARHQLESDLREAVDRGELRLLYQPLVQLSTNEMVGVEALLRWAHPERGLVSPLAFIPLAETSGSILRIGDWVLRQACQQLASWDEEQPGSLLRVSVNVSPRQLEDPEFGARVRQTLREFALDPARVTLEVTETAFGHDPELMISRLRELKDLGVSLAIDDFGTGYSSLSHLRRLPVDLVKIDKSFVAGIAREPAEWALTTAIIRLAASLDKATLAEGIENGGQLAHLRSLNVELGQGYLFARPLPPEGISALLREVQGQAFLKA